MRAFIAIDLPDRLHAALAAAQDSFRAVCPDARWAHPKGTHLTLKFLGEISDAQTKSVVEVLSRIERFEPFSVDVRGFGCFPNAKRPRVLWAGVVAPPALAELAGQIEADMEKIGFAREDRPFAPHLTLARFSVPRPLPELEAAIAARSGSPLGSFGVSEFFLFESKLSPHGAQYRKVMRFPRS